MPIYLKLLGEFAIQNKILFYIYTYLAIIFMGNISSFIALWLGFEFNFQKYHFIIILILTYLGDISGDILWFNLGKLLKNTKLGKFIISHIQHYNGKFEEIIQKNGFKWFLFSKFFYGSSPPISFSLGWSNQEFKKFLKISSTTTLISVPILFGISYGLIFGLTPLRTIKLFEKFEWLFIAGLILFILLEFLISKLIKKIFSILNINQKI
ncbi:MAG: hypothetical protein NZ484_01370 [Patescibacteria group bacterium]|nr:hypothetical protein [Patescibacteria group bacterium]MCX7589324.1 hypothetical protein [Patescibacteria group bacterium]MDW8279661.1 hypothetical protein [bacterium]